MIKFDDSKSKLQIDYSEYHSKQKEIFNGLQSQSLEGSERLGWIELFNDYDHNITREITEVVKELHTKAKTMLVLGIGGSYLGSLAVSSAMNGLNINKEYNLLYVGNNMSSDYISDVFEYCENNDFVVNVISKSGTTLETALAFRIFKKLLIDKYGQAALKDRLIITTDEHTGVLREYANKNNIKTFIIPQGIGGRFSIFTPAGLLPLAFVNIKIDNLIAGAIAASSNYYNDGFDNDAFKYAINRNVLYLSGINVETFVSYEPCMRNLIEWIKQLFGESEGKDGKGLLPIGLIYSTDLHSLGQFVQDGSKILFETVLKNTNSNTEITIPIDFDDLDGLNEVVATQTLHQMNTSALQGVINAHSNQGNTPNLVLEFDRIDEYNIGYLMSFLMYSCTYSAYLLGVNPFNQPGVEVYKEELHKLL